MHGALRIPEVVHHVMEYLVVQHIHDLEEKKKMRATLLNAALTCSLFSGPALDALWRTMDDLIPLFKLLPNFEVSLDKTLPSNIWGGVLEDRIYTFNAYAQRIRRYQPETVNDIHLSAYTSILQRCGRSYLLPNLVHLNLTSPYPDEVVFFLSPGLRELVLHHGGSDPGLLLNSLKSMSPNLVELTLENVVLNNRCLAAVCSLTRLENLMILSSHIKRTVITLDFLLNISARQTLRHFYLDGNLEIVPSSGTNRDPVIFSALQHIDIDCEMAMDSIATLLRHARFPVLEIFRIWLVDQGQQLSMQKHWHEVFDHMSRTTTDHFNVLELKSAGGYVELHLVDLPKLDSLSLTKFALDWVVFGLNHRDVTAIIEAWPRLTSLTLAFLDFGGMDFSALITIARGLPLLQYLKFTCDASIGLERTPLLSHGLDVLILSNSRLDDAEVVARSLDQLFPNLGSFVAMEDDDYEDLWREVGVLLNMLQDVRNDEALRLSRGITTG